MEELREKIARELCRDNHYNWEGKAVQEKYLREADQLLILMKEAGYHKVSGEPPVLSDEGIQREWDKAWQEQNTQADLDEETLFVLKSILQAQRDADVLFYSK